MGRDRRRVSGRALRIYRLLLLAFPTDFRRVYGPDMRATFLDQLRSRGTGSGWSATVVFWFDVFRDTVGEGLKERMARWTGRSRPPPPRRPLRDRPSATVIGLLETAATELRLAARSLLRRPVFASAVVLILGTGLAGATVAWATVHQVLLEPLGYAHEERLVGVWWKNRIPDGTVADRFALSDAQIVALRDGAETLEEVAFVHVTAARNDGVVYHSEGAPSRRLRYTRVSANFFSLLGIRPLFGRLPEPGDRGEQLVVLTEGTWTTQFGRDPGAVGRTMRLGNASYEIVGVLPSDFRWGGFDDRVDLWVLDELEPSRASPFYFNVVARRAPDATAARVEAEVSGLLLGVFEEMLDPLEDPPAPFATVVPLRDAHLGDVGPSLGILGGAVGFVLLLTVVNVALLMLIRTAGRGRDAAVRVALGGGPARVISPLLAEASLLTTAGLLLGIAGAGAGLRALRSFAPSGIPRMEVVGFSWDVLAAGGGAAALVALLVIALPVAVLRRMGVRAVLNSAATSVNEGLAPRALRAPLVVTEVALAVLFLSGAGLMVRSFAELHRLDVGFETEGILQGRLVLPRSPFWESQEGRGEPGNYETLRILPELADFRRALRERLAAHPAVESVSLAKHTPLAGRYGAFTPFVPEGDEDRQRNPDEAWVAANDVDPGFLPMMGVELLSGRGFTWEDHRNAPPVALVSEALARRYWPDQDPLGRRFRSSSLVPDGEGGYRWEEGWVTVVGVVESLREWEYRSTDATVYRPLAQTYPTDGVVPSWGRGPRLSLFVGSTGNAAAASGHVRAAVAELLPGVPVDDLATMDEVAGRWLREPRFYTGLLGALGILSLVLAAGGIAAVVGFGVSGRTREIGLRIALGGWTGEIVRLVTLETLTFVGAGLALGVAASLTLGRVLESFLFRTDPTDPITLTAVVVLFAGVACLAAWIPARRALQVDPVDALRAQ